MRRQNETPGGASVGGGYGSGANRQPHYNTPQAQAQEIHAPSGDLAAYIKDGLICVAGRHLCSVRGDQLERTFDATRELLRGSLLFRLDVLKVAEDAGARVIVATDRATGKAWSVDLQTFRRRGWSYNHARFGAQIGLQLSEWQVIGDDRRGEPEQLSLFQEVRQ